MNKANLLSYLVNDPSCQANVLNISDQHATIVLTRGGERSLINLNLRPFHRTHLPTLGHDLGDDESNAILAFLSRYDFSLTSESGAEYSYYDANPQKSFWTTLQGYLNFWRGSPNSDMPLGPCQATVISPASDRQIQRASPSPKMSMIEEAPEIYQNIVLPHIEEITSSGSLDWITNILEGKKETERTLLDTTDALLGIDTKWRSHPDPNTSNRDEWFEHPSTSDLYCLAILKDSSIRSLRDLNGSHIEILERILADCPPAIEKVYGIPYDQLRIFFHYPPQFYHAHIHFTRLENEVGAQVERGHLLQDVIQNLKMKADFYATRTLVYKVKVTDPLYMKTVVTEE
jgi:m7GpppX diphosphatase